jgi:hypothetical protein
LVRRVTGQAGLDHVADDRYIIKVMGEFFRLVTAVDVNLAVWLEWDGGHFSVLLAYNTQNEISGLRFEFTQCIGFSNHLLRK